MVLVGQGIAYSFSMRMQTAAFRAAGLGDWSYSLLDIPADRVPAAVDGVRGGRYAGANVTIPHKQVVTALVDDLEPEAAAAGAVNTLFLRGGRLVGANTDVEGIRAAAAEIGVESPRRVAVLGAGGSARAVPVAFPKAVVTVISRRRPDWHPRWAPWGSVPQVADAELLVNATPLGRHGELAYETVPETGAVLDLVYDRDATPLVRLAFWNGLAAADGLAVLVAQGAAAFRLWTGLEPPVAAMRQAVRP